MTRPPGPRDITSSILFYNNTRDSELTLLFITMKNMTFVQKMLLLLAAYSISACHSLSLELNHVPSTSCSKDYHVGLNEIEAYLGLNINNQASTKASNSFSIEPVVFGSDTVFYIVNYGKG